MSKARVLKFNRSDSASAHVLIEATPKGSKPLDLKLVATEGEGIFVASCKSLVSILLFKLRRESDHCGV